MSKSTAEEEAHKLVLELYKFRDAYFVDKSLSEATSWNRERDVEERSQITLSALEKLEGIDKSVYCLLKGKVLNIRQEFSQESFECLSRAVKLNPQLTEAWNQLGECYWKKNDFEAARKCFDGALGHDKTNAQSLRSLSIVLRQLGNTPKERSDNLKLSLEVANDAVRADVQDGSSWSVLGNAYMCIFCKSPAIDTSYLKMCKKAYNRTKADKVAASQPDFLYNYSNLLVFEEDYQEALDCLNKAILMDPSWKELKEWQKGLLVYLNDLSDMLVKKGSLKTKRLHNLINELQDKKTSFLGPYNVANGFKNVSIKDLEEGPNNQCVLLVKVIGCVMFEQAVCITVCTIDSQNECIAVTIYNVGKVPKIGDSMAIGNPLVRRVSLVCDSQDISFLSARVDIPTLLVVNGKPFPKSFLARPQVNNVIRH